MKYTQAQLVGTPTKESWAQAFIFEEASDETSLKKGSLFGVVAVKVSPEEEAGSIGKEILATLETGFQEEKSGKHLELLQNLLVKIMPDGKTQIIDLAVGLLWQDVLYLGKKGAGKISIKRDNQIISLLEGLPEQETKVRSASGFIKENDLIILGTPQYTKIIEEAKLQEALDNRPLADVTDILAPQIHNSPDSSASAAIMLKIEGGKQEEVEREVSLPEQKQTLEPEKEELPTSPKQNSLQKVLKNITSKFLTKSSTPLPQLKKEDVKSRRTLFTIAVILLLLLGGSSLLNIQKQQANKQKAQTTEALKQIQSRLDEGKSLLDLNPIRAKTLLEEAQKIGDERKKTLKKGSSEEKEIENILREVRDALNSVSQKYTVSPELFYDLTLIKEKASASALSSFPKNLLLLDSQNNTVYLVDSEKKSGTIVAGGESVKNSTLVSLYGDNAYLLNSQKGITKVNVKTKNAPLEAVKKDDKWGEISGLVSYGGNLYLLDKKANQIWKYIATGEGFSDIQNYLTSDTTPDLSQAQSFAIDGSIWVLRSDGEILKFTQGRIDSFTIVGLDQQLVSPTRIFTNDELKNLYVLDKGNKRVVALAKDGSYKAQYITDIISQTLELTVDESAKKIFLLTGSKIYSIDIK